MPKLYGDGGEGHSHSSDGNNQEKIDVVFKIDTETKEMAVTLSAVEN